MVLQKTCQKWIQTMSLWLWSYGFSAELTIEGVTLDWYRVAKVLVYECKAF